MRWRAPWVRLGAAAALASVACASPPEPLRVTGTATYRERIALPPGVRLQLTLLDVSLVDTPPRIVAEHEVVTSGQVPITFELEVARASIDPARRYGLAAALLAADGHTVFATPAAEPVLTQGAPAHVELLLRRSAPPAGPRLFGYACDGFAFRVEVSRERARLFLPARTVDLPAVPAASGAKYSDGATTYWSRGEEARLEVDGRVYEGCRVVPFRAP